MIQWNASTMRRQWRVRGPVVAIAAAFARASVSALVTPITRAFVAIVAVMTLAPSAAFAQYDPSKVYVEPAAVAARFSDPDVRYLTPSLATDRNDFATHQEVFRFSELLATRSPHARAMIIGRS